MAQPTHADDAEESSELRTLRRRAYEELRVAIDQAGDELPADWLLKGDPDLQSLRDDPDWQLLARRYKRIVTQGDTCPPEDTWLPPTVWGDPHRRANEWRALAGVIFACAAGVGLLFAPIWLLLVLAGFLGVLAFIVVAGFAPKQTQLRLAVILLIVVAIGVALYLLPDWLIVLLALVVCAAISLGMARRAANKARVADERSIARQRRQRLERADQPSPPSAPDGSTHG